MIGLKNKNNNNNNINLQHNVCILNENIDLSDYN